MTEAMYGLTPYNAMANSPMMFNDPEGNWIHIATGAVIGGIVNVAAHWDDAKNDPWGAGLKAFAIGAAGGAFTAATGTGIVGAGLIKGATIGALSSMGGDIITQTGNAVFLDDEYNPKQTLIAGAIGGFAGGITGYLTVEPNVNP